MNETILNSGDGQLLHNPTLFQRPRFELKDVYDSKELTPQLFGDKQSHDPFCFAVKSWLMSRNNADIMDFPLYLKHYVLTGRYSVNKDSGLLEFEHQNERKIVVPAALIKSVMRYGHSDMHHGVSKARMRIFERFWWPKASKDINLYVRSCQACQAAKKTNKKEFDHGKLQLFSCDRPFQMVSIDIVGPLPQTDDGFRYLVTMIDKFSRYCLIQPVKSIRAVDVIYAVQKWITLFGAPESLLSDNGAQFTSYLYEHFSKINETKLKYATAYHPQCNGQVERLHRWIKERLVLLAHDLKLDFVNDDDWSKFIDIIQRSYNTTKTYMTGYSPHEIVFGVKQRTAVISNLSVKELPKATPTEYIKYILARQEIIANKARVQQKHYDVLRKKIFDKANDKNIDFEMGDKVFYNLGERLIGNTKKLTTNYVGPFEIITISNNSKNFTIQEVGNPSNVIKCHRSQIKKLKAPNNALHKTPEEVVKEALVIRQDELQMMLDSKAIHRQKLQNDNSIDGIVGSCVLALESTRLEEEFECGSRRLRNVAERCVLQLDDVPGNGKYNGKMLL